ncbi:uncharacterized protein LOC124615998 [Schistocerca americana]|uniref:uncharacterized protein LOC124615998 n=1 Tax=Schistocerca americana TaxID=7009 RepID=UPI001F4F62D2|nr:uncharacterized protein LOC124615998 [Schistocerca americana]
MTYPCIVNVLTVFFILASVYGDDCFDCVQKGDFKHGVPSMTDSNEHPVYRKRHFFIIIPIGLLVVLCKWCLYCCCKRRRGAIPYRNVEEVTVTVTPETRQPSTSGSLTHPQNFQQQQQQQQPQPLPRSLYNPFQPIPLPPPPQKNVSSTQPAGEDQPPSYSEACGMQLPNKPFYK